jgi:hypothetical protein
VIGNRQANSATVQGNRYYDAAPMPTESKSSKPRPTWVAWFMLVVFVFMAFESLLLAVVFKGAWFVLLAPAVVCAVRAHDIWGDLKRS